MKERFLRKPVWTVCLLLWACAAAPAGMAAARAADAAPPLWTLGDVIVTALRNHPAVGQADAEARAAGARRGQAAAATLPQIGVTAGASWSEAVSPASGDAERSTLTTVQGTVSQLVTDFGRTAATLERADGLAAAAGESARSSRVEVVYAVQVAYLNVLRADSVLGVRNETVRQREGLHRQAQAFFETGLKARIDVVRAEANLYQARADLAGAAHEARTARLLLLNRMGVDGPADFALAGDPAVAEAAGTLEDWQREAEEKHPDLQSLRLQVAAARSAQLAAERGDNPSVTASGRFGFSGDEAPTDRGWSVGAQLSVPVSNGHLTRRQAEEARARLAAGEFALEDRRRQIRLLVAQADQALRDAAERLTVRAKEREALAENLRLATGRYEAGAGDIIEMIDAQVQLAAAETAVVQARFDRATALAALYRALGRLPLAES
ncbi:MAG TPA: TolC family protein [Candidatus Methanoperedens sp.]|nr:TolC family protein [Candidatus Methanoperedens sp.]